MTLAFLFDSVGFGEWFVLLAVVLVVVGPKRLPETARKLGGYYSKFRRAAENFKRQLLDMDTEFTRAADEVSSGVEREFQTGAEPPVAPVPGADAPTYAEPPPGVATSAAEPPATPAEGATEVG